MAFLDLDAQPAFTASRRRGVVVRVHAEWATVSDEAPARTPRWTQALKPVAIVAIAAAVHFWSAAALGSQLLGLATTGVVAAMALSLLTGARR